MSKDKNRPLVLIGLMGAGKTSVGKALAVTLGRDFFDVDQVLVEKDGRDIPTIFIEEGEPFFRALEKNTTAHIVKSNKNAVISIGGGAFMNDETRHLIKEQAFSVFLKAPQELLLQRLGSGEGRPMLKNNPAQTLSSLIETRYPVYAQADITLESLDEPVEETVKRVRNALYNAGALS